MVSVLIAGPPNASIGRNYRPIRVSVSVVHYYYKGWCVRVRTRAICGRTCVGVCLTILKNDNYSSSSELGIFMHWTCNSMNDLSPYCGLVDAKIRASDKNLLVWPKKKILFYLFLHVSKSQCFFSNLNLNCSNFLRCEKPARTS